MEFLRNVFTNFIFERAVSHEALVMGRGAALVTTSMNNQTQFCKELYTNEFVPAM